MDVDLAEAYDAYLARFSAHFGERPVGAFVKFGKHMVHKLTQDDFAPRLKHYLKMHATSKQMLSTGSTINDAVVLEFEEAAAWIAIEAPNMLQMFSGEMGDPEIATGVKR